MTAWTCSACTGVRDPGAVLTGVFASPDLGGTGVWDYVTNQVAEGYPSWPR